MPDADVIEVLLAGAPIGKGRPRFRAITARSGRTFASIYTPAATRRYEGALRYAAQQAMGARAPLEGPLHVRVTATFPVPPSWPKRKRADALAGIVRPAKKPDADNILKVLDSCNEVVFRDDAQVVDAHIVKVYGAKPSLRIEVRPAKLASAAPLLEAAE